MLKRTFEAAFITASLLVSTAQADQPMVLADAEMDCVSAGLFKAEFLTLANAAGNWSFSQGIGVAVAELNPSVATNFPIPNYVAIASSNAFAYGQGGNTAANTTAQTATAVPNFGLDVPVQVATQYNILGYSGASSTELRFGGVGAQLIPF